MDPTQCYLDMIHAMNAGDIDQAYTHALNLKAWLDRGGLYPVNHTRKRVDASLANALRRTSADAESFSLCCISCDAGMEILTEQEALSSGWTEIGPVDDLANATHLGICPDCKRDTA